MVKYEEAGRLWDLDNSTRDVLNQNKTITSQDIYAISNHQVKLIVVIDSSNPVNPLANVTKLNSAMLKIKLATGVTKWAILPVNVDPLQAWGDSIEVNYNSANQSIYEQIDPVAAIHNVHKKKKNHKPLLL